MSRSRTIQYILNADDNNVYSQVHNQVAIPVLNFEGMNSKNNYLMNYSLEKFDVLALRHCGPNLINTRKIPNDIKNLHRKFWGMKIVK